MFQIVALKLYYMKPHKGRWASKWSRIDFELDRIYVLYLLFYLGAKHWLGITTSHS